jgi:hypothetical protein
VEDQRSDRMKDKISDKPEAGKREWIGELIERET